MKRVSIEDALPSDDADIRRLIAHVPMEGAVSIAFRCEPNAFDAAVVQGAAGRIWVARDADTQRIVGMGARHRKRVYINGRATDVGYLSRLRLEEEYRGGLLLARAYRFLRERHETDPVALYLTTIVEDNLEAKRLLCSGKCGLPTYHDFGRFCTMAINPRQRIRAATPSAATIRSATREDVPDVVQFLNREGALKQFFPVYEADDLVARDGLLRELALDDILLAHVGGELVGTLGTWNQQSFSQSVVSHYGRGLTMLRPLYNLAALLRAAPRLPGKGANLDYANLALTCVREDDLHIFQQLLTEAALRCRARHALLMAGLHERDPLLPVLKKFHCWSYPSRLYVACWDDGEDDFHALDNRTPYLELGAL